MTQIAQVVIIGAGLSSLRAAREVHNAGLSYIALEAMDRVRGKTLSVQASEDNGVVDLGASWINDPSQSESSFPSKLRNVISTILLTDQTQSPLIPSPSQNSSQDLSIPVLQP